MKVFYCDHCDNLIFFENTVCNRCGNTLAFLPDRRRMGTLVAEGDNRWRLAGKARRRPLYRLCGNYQTTNVCNWAVPHKDPSTLCPSCRLTRVIPNLGVPGHAEAWYRLEVAKRRLIYGLLELRLPILDRQADPKRGLAFKFLADPPPGTTGPAVMTGHAQGVITISVAEADDAEREKRRLHLHEPYRTLLGHFRHEIGHYYWDRLIAGSTRLDAFRAQFGDERADYAQALQAHYEQGPSTDWQNTHVSSYASAHPWEDWAETWAHYLHIVDTLETASACRISLRHTPVSDKTYDGQPVSDGLERDTFARLMDRWMPMTFVLNNLNRGLGLGDAYPFVLSMPVIDKLRFVHETIAAYRAD
ncbi:zinc-binding metallopeptidase family protein [Solimonas marina]|uniref:Zinc-ribbon domain-containing protein n=1 Tax=Solimonas marina TaxID=2714601 RepID=A0A969WAH8_9GAMM|nr:hypothetical protein [Solimonas marina]